MTTPGGYSAGTIFLTVVPSFKDFHKKILREAKLADKAVREQRDKDRTSDDRDGQRAARQRGKAEATEYAGAFREGLKRSIKDTQREIEKIKLTVDDEQAQDTFRTIRSYLDDLNDREINIDADADSLFEDLVLIKAELEAIQALAGDLNVDVDLGAGIAKIKALQQQIDGLRNKQIEVEVEAKERSTGLFASKLKKSIQAAMADLPDIEVNADSSDVLHQIAQIRAQLQILDQADITPGVKTNQALLELARLRDELRDISVSSTEADVIVNTGSAHLELAKVTQSLNAIDGRVARARVAITDIRDIDRAGNSFRIFRFLILGVAAALPLIVPAAAAAAGAIVLLGTAAAGAGVGLGVLVLGFTGISGAVQALGDAQKNGAKDSLAASKTMRNAGKAVRDAEQGVSRARQSAADSAEDAARRVQDAQEGIVDAQQAAARAVEDALRRQERAERNLARAQRDSAEAVADLAKAREEAQQDIKDTSRALRQNALDERQAVLDLFAATTSDISTRQDGGATNVDKEEAAIRLENARLSLERIRETGMRLKNEQGDQQSKGVDGSERVQTAQERVNDAVQNEVDARRELSEAAESVADARVAGAKRVQDAEEQLTEAVRAQARASRDGAQGVADAQERLTEAQVAYGEALHETAVLGSASKQALDEAMAKLGPAGQAFAIFLHGLRDDFKAARDAVQAGLLPGVQKAIENLLPYMPQITAFLAVMGETLGELFVRASEALTSPVWANFFEMMAQYAPTFTTLFAEVFGQFFTILAQLMTAFAPLAEEFMGGFVAMLAGWSEYLASPEGQQMLMDFMDYLREAGPAVLDFLGSFVKAVLNLAEGLAPYADILLKVWTGILDFLAGLDPAILGALTFALITAVIAIQTLAGIGALLSTLGFVSAAFGFLAGAIGIGALALLGWIALAFAVVAILVVLYTESETARNIINGAFSAIGAVISWVWDNLILPIFKAWWGWITFIFDVWTSVADLIIKMFQALWQEITASWANFMTTGAGQALGDFMDWVADRWSSAMSGIAKLWDILKDASKTAIRFVVDTVINDGLIDGFNTLAEAFGSKPITRIQLPASMYQTSESQNLAGQRSGGDRRTSTYNPTPSFYAPGYATGGMVPGFSATPTADNIPAMLTAGEYVLPVNAVRALRAKYGDQFLEMLRNGLPGYASGGLVEFGRLLQSRGYRVAEHPAFGGVRGKHANGSQHYKGNAIDVNWAPGTSLAEQRMLAAILPLAREYGLRSIFMAPGHYGHAHFDGGGGGSIVGNIAGWLKDKAGTVIDAPLSWLAGQVRGLYGSLKENAFGGLLIGGAEAMIKAAATKLVNLGADAGDFFTKKGEDAPPQGYAAGGEVKLYDEGGWLQPGLTTVLNASGRPEPVFSAQQWEQMERGGGGGDTITIPVTQQQDPEAVAQAVLFAKRHLARGGVYAGRTS